MTKENIVHFEMDDYVDDVRDTVAKIRHRDFPIVDENQNSCWYVLTQKPDEYKEETGYISGS